MKIYVAIHNVWFAKLYDIDCRYIAFDTIVETVTTSYDAQHTEA